MLLVSKCAIFIGLVFTLPCVVYGRQYGTPGKTLYVDEEKQAGGKLTVINRATVQGPDSHLARRKREATTLDSPGIQKNISTWTTHLNDSHQQLMVHWVGEGSNVIICLARDSSPRNKGGVSPSALFISYDYGKNFTNKTESFRLGDTPDNGYAQLDKFFNHPKYPEFCVFVDSTNQKLYYTSDNGNTIHRSDLNFHPSELAFDEEFPDKYVVLDKVDTNRKLYLTLDGGKTFKMIQSFVKTFVWSSGPGVPKVFYVERWKPDGTSTVFSASDPRDLAKATVLFEEAKDFQIKGDYMFATKQSKEANSLHLYISHQRGPFYKAEFGTELDLRKFHIADVTDKRIFVSVMHTDTLANLYVSEIGNNFTQYNFVLSLDQILSYFPDGNWKDSWLEDVTEDSFTDLYRVEGVKGVYIASYVDPRATGSIGPEHLFSVITFDHGVTWAPIRPPTEDENGKPLNCPYGSSCSLHLCQKFSQLYPVTSLPGSVTNGLRSASIMSSKSAPGIIMATGVLGKSLKGIPGVYLSRDAGLTWKRILKDYYFFNYGDHGGVLVAVKYFKSRGETRRILYSTNEGIDWNSYQFNAEDLRIYGLMTEPGENTTTFTMFGSANDHHQWIIITIDLRNTFPRNCTQDDFKFWSPSPPNSSVSCVLGTRNTFQRRLAHTNCYHGVDFERGVTKEVCECSRRDFECDFGFMLSGNDCIRNKTAKYDPYTIPGGCRPGHYYQRTKGYRKIDGDVCTISGYMSYVADMVPCPLQQPQEFLLVALRDRIARIDLYDNSTIFPVEFQKNVVAIEADIKNNCIYWADIEMDKISRQCFNESTPQEVIVDTDLASIEGMALDWISNVLFFVDGLRKKIEAVRTDLTSQGRMRVTILDEAHLSKPRGIAVHPRAGYLFWTDWDRNNPSVSRSHLDGTEVTRLFSKPIVQWPNGITIDHMSERIYWVDAMEDYIASSDLNGKFFKRILGNNEKVSHPFAVAVLKDKIFWDDWKERSIFSADKDTGMDIISIQDSLISFIGLMDVKAFAHFTQHGSNACSYKNTSCDTMCLGGPGNTFTCLCPEGFKMTNGKCLCPNGLEPSANMTCPKKPGGTCDANEFTCKNGQCIMWVWRCDGNNDCGDLSDEVGCHCAPPMVTCDSNRCYLPSWKCDGDMDCVDMSDEQDCGSHNCTENQFQCANGHCIEKRWLCDGDNDCKDGSDERNCSIVSKRPLMNCQNGFACGNDSELCVPTSWVCDGEHDCPSGDDEKEERCKNSTCAPYMFRCPNGKCIFKSWVCDGENDCSDVEASDEKNCTNVGHSKLLPNPSTPLSPNFPVNGTCLDWMFKCKNGNCLPDWWRCDSIDDCGDHSDEIGCGLVLPETKNISPEVTTARHKCAKNQFTCAPGVCIPLTWVCDGVNDCTQGSDEKDCVSRAPAAPPCAADATPCADGGGCVDDARLCDGVYDCTDRSDEAMCPTKTKHKIVTECSAGEFSCDDGSDCIPISYLCDGSQNCWDASDEANCSAAGTDTHMYQFLSIGVDQSSINSTSFLISCWMAQQKMVQYSFLPSISKVGDNAWNNMTWTNDSIYRFTNLEPYTNYNVTFYIRDSRSNITYASNKYVNTTTGEGVPSPPGNLSIHQFIGSRLQVTFDAPSQPRGDILFYTLFYSPPTPPMQKVIPAYNKTISIVIHSYFKPNVNYSFWVQATNNVYSSNTTEILYMTFEEVGDIDDINNVRMSRPTNDSVRLEWHRIPDVDGYKIQLDLPYAYAKREPIVTQDNFVTITDLPPGCDMHIEIRAFKSHFYSDPFTVPLKTEGIPHEIIAPDLYILAEENTVHLNWTRPMSLRYNGKNLTYDVHYSNIIRRTNPGEVSNDTRIITNATEVTIRDLHACELYRFSVGLLNGPLIKTHEILTRPRPTAPIRNLKVAYDEKETSMKIMWEPSCGASFGPFTYRVEVTEETRNRTSRYELYSPTNDDEPSHEIVNVPIGARFNICVKPMIPHAEVKCTKFRTRALETPSGVRAWLAVNGHVMVSWEDQPARDHTGFKYQVIVSEKEIPDDILDPTEDMQTTTAEFSPVLMNIAGSMHGPLYVGVRSVTHEGYYSDLSEVQTLVMLGSAEPVSSLSSLWWGAGAALLVSVLLAGALVHAALRHRRLSRSFLRFTAAPRYDSRRGQATLTEHDDDDVPPIHGFSDDEPLVIA